MKEERVTDDQVLIRRGVTLSEQQWRLVKAHAAQRGQTISEWFQSMIVELGLGQSPGARYPAPVQLIETSIVKDPPSPAQTIRPVTPAPKPSKAKR